MKRTSSMNDLVFLSHKHTRIMVSLYPLSLFLFLVFLPLFMLKRSNYTTYWCRDALVVALLHRCISLKRRYGRISMIWTICKFALEHISTYNKIVDLCVYAFYSFWAPFLPLWKRLFLTFIWSGRFRRTHFFTLRYWTVEFFIIYILSWMLKILLHEDQ